MLYKNTNPPTPFRLLIVRKLYFYILTLILIVSLPYYLQKEKNNG